MSFSHLGLFGNFLYYVNFSSYVILSLPTVYNIIKAIDRLEVISLHIFNF